MVRLLGLALLAALLGGCSLWLDADRSRICRQLVPLIAAPGQAVEVETVRGGPGGSGVTVLFAERTTEGRTRRRLLQCVFADAGLAGRGRVEITHVLLDGRPVGELRLALWRRFWIGSGEAEAADPQPVMQAWPLPELPLAAAIGLQQAVAALPQTAIYMLLAGAYALIYGLVGRINLAFGELAAVAGYASVIGISIAGADVGLALALGLALAVWAALMHGLVTARHVMQPLVGFGAKASGQQALIGTIGLALALQEYMRLAQGASLRWVGPVLATPIAIAAAGSFAVTVTPIALIVVLVACTATLALLKGLDRTRLGRAWRAVSDDPLAAALLGIDPARVLARAFLIASLLAALAGFIMTVFYGGVGFAGGIVLGLKALIGAVIGGIGSVPAAVAGGLAIGLMEALWSATLPIEHRDLFIYAALAAALIWRPQGLMGAAGPDGR
jgi:branched-subunit amino acid ABC-type transport system permease component